MPDEFHTFDAAPRRNHDPGVETGFAPFSGPAAGWRLSRAVESAAAGAELRQVSASEFAADPQRLTLVATPQYRSVAADGPFIRWAVAVRSDAAVLGLADLRGRRLAVVEGDADGATLFRAEVAPLTRGIAFFAGVTPFPDAEAALDAVAGERVEAALVDGLSWAARVAIRSNRVRLRLLQWTPRAPAPPLVIDASAPPGAAEALAEALDLLTADSEARSEVLAPLGVERFHRLPKAQYRALLHYDQIASSQGYEALR